MADEKDSAASEAKGLSNQLLELFGLKELVFGGLLVYDVWVPRQAEFARALPTTGKTYVDVALWAFAAAVVGRVLFFAVSVVWALASLAIVKRRRAAALIGQLDSLYGAGGRPADENPGDVAATAIARAWPARVADLERRRTSAMFAYACALLSLVVLGRVAEALGLVGWRVTALSIGGMLVFGALGLLFQLDYVGELTRAAGAINTAKLSPPKTSETSETSKTPETPKKG